MFSSRKIDYLRIILFMPLAWVAYNISMHLIIKISNKSLIEVIGISTWRYGIDIIQLLVFLIVGTLIAPKVVRILCGISSILIYIFAYFYSIYVTPILLNTSIENDTFAIWSSFSYLVRFIILLIVVVIIIYQYQKRIKQDKL
jgi:hypothetical protein